MELNDFIYWLNSGKPVAAGDDIHQYMTMLSQEAIKITTQINSTYHKPAELRMLFSELIGGPVDDGFYLFPPFTTDCGKNLHLGRDIFINSGCRFQDQGGITIGDGVLIGHNVVLATLNHDLQPEKRHNMIPAPIKIGNRVWIGSNSTILPGVTIGDNAVVGAGAVVTKDIPPGTIAAGNPARWIRQIDEREGR